MKFKMAHGDSFYPAFDKGVHFIGSMVVAGLITAVSGSLIAGAGITLLLGITKEVLDATKPNGSGFSLQDLTYDVAAITIVCIFAYLNTHGMSGY